MLKRYTFYKFEIEVLAMGNVKWVHISWDKFAKGKFRFKEIN